ncbi:MAG: hypothetical protein ACXVDN_16465, partial [Ktedonobacteraceae bacterium]
MVLVCPLATGTPYTTFGLFRTSRAKPCSNDGLTFLDPLLKQIHYKEVLHDSAHSTGSAEEPTFEMASSRF